ETCFEQIEAGRAYACGRRPVVGCAPTDTQFSISGEMEKRDFGRKRPELKFPGESSARASVCWPSDRLSSEGIFRRRAFALIYGHGQRSDVKIQVLCHFMSTFERPSFQVKPE